MRIARSTVEAGENVVSLAARLTGDPLRWQELVRLNKLRAPYIASEPRAGVLSPGDAVLYPAPDSPATLPNAAQLEQRTYKRDLRVQRGDLVLSGSTLVTDAGLPNLQAALSRRLMTLVGRHPFHPAYGSLIPLHVGAIADAARLRLAVSDARRAVMRDPRVQDCTITGLWQESELVLTLNVTPIPPGTPFTFTYQS
ncbi:DUF2634 domain-containing protein [Deinococcus sp. UR1]|uniref:DUF2634 domain-containing protein n=1 Tax=Deinococcus sp. UR1 TaxID=1704277 RepID=UPI000C188451|nr:DUF2634 domain-containing protein [Deinococcus sp. UR1]PIG96874.1 hypothetical protein AMD26_015205 [Deinococcus sp. UR1]